MKRNLKVAFASFAVTATANAQSMALPDVTSALSNIFLQLGFGEFTFEKYVFAVAASFVGFFLLPYLTARLNGMERESARFLGLQGLFGGLLLVGFFTAPIGLIVLGRALFSGLFPPTRNTR
jgi:hypothetical protein